MMFLSGHIKSRATTGNCLLNEKENPSIPMSLEECATSQAFNYSPVSAEKSPTKKKIKVDVQKKVNVDEELLSILKKNDEEDEEKLFCASLVPALKRMTPRNRNKAKMEMLQVLDKYEFCEPIEPPNSTSFVNQLYFVPHTAPNTDPFTFTPALLFPPHHRLLIEDNLFISNNIIYSGSFYNVNHQGVK
jgi:hypothetical protein